MERILFIEKHGETVNNVDGGGANGLSHTCYSAIVDNWAKARIDGPMKVIERYDDTAKILVTLGGFSPALLAALYGILSPKEATPGISLSGWVITFLIISLFCFGGFFFSVIMACRRQVMMVTKDETPECSLPNLIEQAATTGLSANDMKNAVGEWCKEIDGLIKYKHNYVQAASIFLVISLLMLSILFMLIIKA